MGTIRKTDADARLDTAAVASSLEQVRELLFGQQYRELERKLARVDSHLAGDTEVLRGDLRQRLEALQTQLYKEVEALANRLAAEHTAQLDALNQVARESRDVVAALELRVTKLEEGLARSQRDVRQQILDQAKQFLDEMQHVRGDLARAFERELVALREGLEGPEAGAGATEAAAPVTPPQREGL
jgi:hypothetical protein